MCLCNGSIFFFVIPVLTHSPLKALLSHNHTALIAQIWKQKYVLLSLLTKLSPLKYATTKKLSIAFPDKSALCQFISAFKLYFKKYLSTKKTTTTKKLTPMGNLSVTYRKMLQSCPKTTKGEQDIQNALLRLACFISPNIQINTLKSICCQEEK